MVLQKRLGYGFNGYQVPTIPRGSRSARGKRPVSEKVENNKTCAFDILATIANTLLQDRETSPSTSDVTAKRAQFLDITKNTIKEEYHDGAKLYKAEACDQGSNDETVIAKDTIKSAFRPASIITKSDRSDKVACPEESTAGKSVDTLGNFSCSNVNFWDTCSSKDPIKLHSKPPVLINSDTTVNVPFGGAHSHSSSFRECRDDVQVVSRDNDENSSGCGQPRTIMLKAYRPQGVGNRKIRKLLASRNWEVAPRLLKDGEISNTDVQMKAGILSRKTCFTRRRTQRCSPFKRRKLFERSSMWTSDRGICNQVSGVSSPAIGKRSSFKAGDSHVKLSIKSFRVPELFIEIPETATVGSLKRAVMDAITAIIGDGLRVGVLLQGRKVRDDNKTLHQTGISHDDKLDSLGFTLEPSPSDAPPPLCSKDPHYLLSCDATQPQTRYPASPAIDTGASTSSLDHPSLTNSGDCLESDHDLVPSLTDTSLAKTTPNSRALISMQTMSVETLEVVPFHQKSRRSDEIVQRRIRRPFSVSEVEALVHAVEELGTGRWRDVKIRAFDNAKHRTYVDLKDKWKTLVHTARIAPQQRRGQPVPQELLDRVLSAHAYWSEQQTKHISEGCFISN